MNAHILIVDDDRRVTSALRRTLAYEVYQVSTALDGEGALAIARTKSPDLVILDLMLPGIDGFDVCRRLRAADDGVAVLMLTARDAVADRVAGLEMGADDYLVKPFALEELLARVKALLRNPRIVLTRNVLMDRIWGRDFEGGPNVLEVYIGHLRNKLEQHGEKRLIQTVRGAGYVLRAAE